MAQQQTDIRITATNDASGPVNQIRADFSAMARELRAVFAELGAAGKSFENAFRQAGSSAQIAGTEIRSSLVEVGNTATTAGKATEGAFDAATRTAKATGGAFKNLTGTAKEMRGGFSDIVTALGGTTKAVKETDGATVEARKGMAGLGAAVRAALEVFSHVGPNATKQIANVAAATVDLSNKAKALGESGQGFDTFADGAKRAGDAIETVKHKLDDVRKKVGLGLIAAGGAGLYGLSQTVAPAAVKETQLASIGALAKSDAKAREIYGITDAASTDSASNLPELVAAAKSLTAQSIFSKRYLTAADDAAAVDPQRLKPEDVARALARLSVGDTGEALERFRDIGISRKDIEAKGVKFDGGGALQDKSQAGIDKVMEAVISSIEQKFGGLSKRIATTTFEGAVSNLDDAVGRFKTSIGEAFIPALTMATKFLTGLVGVLNSVPEPIKQAIAWVAAIGFGFIGFVGVLLILSKTIGTIVFAFKALQFVAGLTGGSVFGLVRSLFTLAGTLVSTLLPAVSTTITGILAKAKLMGAVGIGLGLGTFMADQVLQTQRSRGDKGAAGSVGEAASNAWARLTGGEITEEDGLTATQRRAKIKEEQEEKKRNATVADPPVDNGYAIASVKGMYQEGGVEADQAEIERLQDAIRATDDKAKKKKLQLQLFYATRAQRHGKQNAAALKREAAEQKRLEREAEALRKKRLRETGFASGADAAEFGAEADERIAGLRSGGEIGELRARRSLNQQIRAIKSSDLAKDAKSDRISALRDLYNARDAARKADTDAQVSELEAQKALAEGAAQASGQEGGQRAATLRKAAATAERLREVGVLKSRADKEEADEAAKDAQERLDATNKAAGRGGNGLAALFAAGRLKGSYNRSSARGGSIFAPGMGSFAGSFIGDQGTRLRDAAQSQAAFARLGYNRAGENPKERPQLQAAVLSVFNDILQGQHAIVDLSFVQQAPNLSRGMRQ